MSADVFCLALTAGAAIVVIPAAIGALIGWRLWKNSTYKIGAQTPADQDGEGSAQ